MYTDPLAHPITSLPNGVHYPLLLLSTNVCLSACHPRGMPLSQPLRGPFDTEAVRVCPIIWEPDTGMNCELQQVSLCPTTHSPPFLLPLLLTHLHGNRGWNFFFFFLVCLLARQFYATPLPAAPSSPHPPATKCPIKRQLEACAGSVVGASH